jgi:hypothetical protein
MRVKAGYVAVYWTYIRCSASKASDHIVCRSTTGNKGKTVHK